jgi:hypothetical protein
MHNFQMSGNAKIPLSGVKQSRWSHPLVLVASLVGLVGSSATYYAVMRARRQARSSYLSMFASCTIFVKKCIFRNIS